MDNADVAEELRAPLAKLPVPDVSKPVIRWLMSRATQLAKGTATEGVAIDVRRDGEARVRVHRPQTSRTDAALIWVHGGGLVMGSAALDDAFAGHVAAALGMIVIAPDYRLAPQHRAPAALDDVVAAWDWVQANADELGIDPARVTVGGESAGGGLAAAAAQRIADRAASAGGNLPLAQWLFAPMLDDRTAADRSLDSVAHPVWTNRRNRAGWKAYLGHEPGLPAVPDYAVPARRASLDGLPPAWVMWGDIDLFAAEDADYAERLAAAGVETTTDVVPGGAHGFTTWARETAIARETTARGLAWLASRTERA